MLLLAPFVHDAAVSVCLRLLDVLYWIKSRFLLHFLVKKTNCSEVHLNGMFCSEGAEITVGFVEVDGWVFL